MTSRGHGKFAWQESNLRNVPASSGGSQPNEGSAMIPLMDAVDELVEQLKILPLIASADLDGPFAAYDAFELVLGAILRAALVQAPEEQRRRHNRELFERFVVERFPEGRGRGDAEYAANLWEFRNAVVKNKQTGPFLVIHNSPVAHWKTNHGILTLDLQSLIEDFREAVDNLGALLRSTDEMRELAARELDGRTVKLVPIR